MDRGAVPYDARMLAVIWHYWLGVALAIGAVGMIAKMVVDYFRTVESQRYPKGK